ncbi:hypothetical protein TBR22_A18770 [Luteitalea sp. TBR-22]|uniref:hypothetical protein n=1 Tax=Luteitalea sp. TBR-22 TaxID=2802971 RepID=UPI001AF7310A|nr:hypothetical protein [Luteitalea sp. TBR-22]BCS32663.1 hypothetical protein TBR22_A18770 [Luteitalea sp. TBR-22]
MFMTRNHQRRVVGAFAACLAGLTLTMAQPEAIQGVRFTATASGPTGELGPVEIVINRFSTTVEKNRFMDTFAERGPAGLQEALQQAPSIGRLAAPGDQGFELRYAAELRGENGERHVIVASDQGMSFLEAADRPRSADYPFTVIQLQIDRNGQGRGLASAYSTITLDTVQGSIVLENLGDQPVMLTNLQLQRKGGRE